MYVCFYLHETINLGNNSYLTDLTPSIKIYLVNGQRNFLRQHTWTIKLN